MVIINVLILLGTLRQFLRHLEPQNLSIMLDSLTEQGLCNNSGGEGAAIVGAGVHCYKLNTTIIEIQINITFKRIQFTLT